MGAWGPGVFDDDEACDWYDEFCRSDQSIISLEETFEIVIQSKEYLHAGEGIAALVAAEILAASLGRPTARFPDEEYHLNEDEEEEEKYYVPKPDLERIKHGLSKLLMEKASIAVAKVQQYEQSELRALWQDSNLYEEWRDGLDDLRNRLK